jgi:hypothetical protein
VGPSSPIDPSMPNLHYSTRGMALRQLLLQRISDNNPLYFQSLKNLREVALEPHPVRAFQDTQRAESGSFRL